jgi:hypothetical protein
LHTPDDGLFIGWRYLHAVIHDAFQAPEFFSAFEDSHAQASIISPKARQKSPHHTLMFISIERLYISASARVMSPNTNKINPTTENIKPMGRRISSDMLFILFQSLPEQIVQINRDCQDNDAEQPGACVPGQARFVDCVRRLRVDQAL